MFFAEIYDSFCFRNEPLFSFIILGFIKIITIIYSIGSRGL